MEAKLNEMPRFSEVNNETNVFNLIGISFNWKIIPILLMKFIGLHFGSFYFLWSS